MGYTMYPFYEELAFFILDISDTRFNTGYKLAKMVLKLDKQIPLSVYFFSKLTLGSHVGLDVA